MTDAIFVDTNVFVYSHQADEPLKQPLAERWLDRLWAQRTGRTSAQVLNEYHAFLTRKRRPVLAPEESWEHIRALFEWNPHQIDTDVLIHAHVIERRYRLNWWDCLIIGAARAQNCALVLSEDMQDRCVYGGVTVRNPFVLGVSEPAAEYTVVRAPVSGRRVYGRP